MKAEFCFSVDTKTDEHLASCFKDLRLSWCSAELLSNQTSKQKAFRLSREFCIQTVLEYTDLKLENVILILKANRNIRKCIKNELWYLNKIEV